MSRDTAELVRSLYEAFAQGDVPYVLGKFSPELVWNEAEGFVYADRNPYVGPQAVIEGVFLRLAMEWAGFSVTPEEIVASGDTAVALGRYRGTSKASGMPVDAQFAHVWKLADGKVVSYQQYTDTAQFRDAVAMARAAEV
jgi:ketosteroid isomerase-like protein